MSSSDQLRLVYQRGPFGLVVFCTIVLTGCGGGNEPAPEAAAAESSSESSASAEASPAPAVAIDAAEDSNRRGKGKRDDDDVDPVPAAAAATPNGNSAGMKFGFGSDKDDERLDLIPAAASLTTEVVPALTARPENVDAWTNDDFLAAAREHDPKLLDAIDFKVKSSPGDAAVAALLTRLLDPSSPPAEMIPAETTPAATSPPATPAESATGTDSAPPIKTDPQTSTENSRDRTRDSVAARVPLAVDSATAMILESAVTWMPQGAAVGAIASGVPERIADDSGAPPRRRSKKDEAEDDGMIQPVAPLAAAAPGVGSLQDRELVEHVIDGLIANNSQDAWHSVYGIVAGTVKTPIPAALTCEIVVERLFQNLDSNPAAISPGILTFLDSASAIPLENRVACIRMLTAISAAHIGRLTGFAKTAQSSDKNAGEVNGLAGFGAGQALFGGRSRKDRDDEDGGPFISAQGGGMGSNAAITKTTSLPNVSLTPDIVKTGATLLWSPEAVAKIVHQLESTTDLSESADIILLASTIPIPEVRQAMSAAFLRLHADGSEGLESSGLFTDVHDPALLVILKSQPRTRPVKEAPGTMDSWTSGTQKLVLSLRNELRRTAGSMKPVTENPPVKLHKKATAELSVMLGFNSGIGATAGEADPSSTEVYYTRTSFSPQKQRDIDDLTEHYEGRTSGYSRPDAAKGVMWIEGVKTLPNGHRRSIDVVIEKAGAGGGGGSFVIEIIVVDTQDPKPASPAQNTQASAK